MGADTAKMVEGGRKEKHSLVNKRLEDGRVGRGRATPELLPLGKVVRASSGNRMLGDVGCQSQSRVTR
jgi:hypothetical protein